MSTERRGFLRSTSVGVLTMLGVPALARGQRRAAPPEDWLEGLNGRHKQILDVAAHGEGSPLRRTGNLLKAYTESYDLKDSDINVVFCAHGTGLAIVLGEALWAKYDLGAFYSINDPQTNSAATRNIFSGTGSAFNPSVATLQKRGVRFIACMQTIARLSRTLAAQESSDAAAVNSELLAGLLPGVTAVPAAIVAVNRAQESGLTYAFIG